MINLKGVIMDSMNGEFKRKLQGMEEILQNMVKAIIELNTT